MGNTEIIEMIKDAAFFGGNIQRENYEECRNFFDNVIEKQLILTEVSNLFASGKKVQIFDCLHGHEFGIGEIVTLKNKRGNQWLARGFDGNEWYIDEDEANCV